MRSLLLLLLFSTGLCNCSNILLHSLLHLSLSLSLSHSPESKGFYQGAPTRPDITGRGSVVVVVMEEEGEASYPLPHTWVLQGKSSPLFFCCCAVHHSDPELREEKGCKVYLCIYYSCPDLIHPPIHPSSLSVGGVSWPFYSSKGGNARLLLNMQIGRRNPNQTANIVRVMSF